MEGHGILACGCAVRLASAREPANGFLGVPRGHRQREADLFALPCPFPSLILGNGRGHKRPKRSGPADRARGGKGRHHFIATDSRGLSTRVGSRAHVGCGSGGDCRRGLRVDGCGFRADAAHAPIAV